MSSGNSVTLADPETGEVYVHVHALKKGVLRATFAKNGTSLSADLNVGNIAVLLNFFDDWLRQEEAGEPDRLAAQ